MQAWTAWLAGTPVARAMRDGVWLYPAVETVHIIGFAVLVGAVAMFDLRVLGFAHCLLVRILCESVALLGLLFVMATKSGFGSRPLWRCFADFIRRLNMPDLTQ
ncbi:hypothetical protein IP92_02782 [Pseudoduganella flava]|uniref:Uncharacterized protein n=1 Tax=Pseudoduganella flava TaxID=871742 RepID=A0A562PTF9_9BURK|nr:hypothetical protein [Pseudoduganella flava]QGZ39013.1 hypothetical protein GO485_08090 [Pseudoduganella flava]TWI47721.1 hypothetical protein IP92_02782 [Pseudoduganella flava]